MEREEKQRAFRSIAYVALRKRSCEGTYETQNDPVREEPSPPASAEKPLSQISSSRLKELRASEQAKGDVKNIIFITQQYLGHPLNTTDIRRILYLYDELHLSVDLIDYLVEYCVSRELDWFWAPLGTWIISWYNTRDRLFCQAYVDDCARKVTIVFDYLDRTPDDEGIKMFKNF